MVYKNITLILYSWKGSKLQWYERDRWRQMETNRDGGRQRQTAILTNSCASIFIFRAPLFTSVYWPEGTQLEACYELLGTPLRQRGSQPLTDTLCDWLDLFWPQAEIDSSLTVSHMSISLYHYTTLTHFCSPMWQFPLIYAGVYSAEKSLIGNSVKSQYVTFSTTHIWKISSHMDFSHGPS